MEGRAWEKAKNGGISLREVEHGAVRVPPLTCGAAGVMRARGRALRRCGKAQIAGTGAMRGGGARWRYRQVAEKRHA